MPRVNVSYAIENWHDKYWDGIKMDGASVMTNIYKRALLEHCFKKRLHLLFSFSLFSDLTHYM